MDHTYATIEMKRWKKNVECACKSVWRSRIERKKERKHALVNVAVCVWMSVFNLQDRKRPLLSKVLFLFPFVQIFGFGELGAQRRKAIFALKVEKKWSFKNINAIALVHAMMIYTTAWSAYNVYRGDSVDSILTVFSSFIYIVFCAQVNQ